MVLVLHKSHRVLFTNAMASLGTRTSVENSTLIMSDGLRSSIPSTDPVYPCPSAGPPMKRRRLARLAVSDDRGIIEWRAPLKRSQRRQTIRQASCETYIHALRDCIRRIRGSARSLVELVSQTRGVRVGRAIRGRNWKAPWCFRPPVASSRTWLDLLPVVSLRMCIIAASESARSGWLALVLVS